MSRRAVVVVVGRPNVGKSTLFNRLTGSRRALVHDLPGVTRDRILGDACSPGGRDVMIVDTGGLVLGEEEGWVGLIRQQAEEALRTADAVLLLVDGGAGVVPQDRDLAEYLRTLGRPLVLAVNKADLSASELQAAEFYRLGIGDPVLISAEHGRGIDDLWQRLEELLPPEDEPEEESEDAAEEVRIAIVGRPNVGKSSLLNRLVGEPRVMVSEVPGTTRDVVDVVLEHEGRRLRVVDTAGIRRKGKTDRGPEVLSVVVARRALEQADLCLVLVDALEGVTKQDAHVAGYAWEAGRGVVLVVNKWDLMEERGQARERLENQLDQHMRFLASAPRVFLSAKTGAGVHKLFPAVERVRRAYGVQASTSELNRVLRAAWDRHPPAARGRQPKLFYATQVFRRPPGFAVFTNLQAAPHFSFVRQLENALREHFDLAGVPVKVMIRTRRR